MKRDNDEDLAVLVSLNQVAVMTSMSRTMVNAYRTSGRFPAAVMVGGRRVAFVKSEVLDWIEKRIEERKVTLSIKQRRAKGEK